MRWVRKARRSDRYIRCRALDPHAVAAALLPSQARIPVFVTTCHRAVSNPSPGPIRPCFQSSMDSYVAKSL
jgi:hypothetical protein